MKETGKKKKTTAAVIPSHSPISERVAALEHVVSQHTRRLLKLEGTYSLMSRKVDLLDRKVDTVLDAVRTGNDCNAKLVDAVNGLSVKVDGLSCQSCEGDPVPISPRRSGRVLLPPPPTLPPGGDPHA